MPDHEWMSVSDATTALLILAVWEAPDGVKFTVGCSGDPECPGRRKIHVAMGLGVGEPVQLVRINGVPDQGVLDTLDDIALQLVDAAWDQPACVSLAPGVAVVSMPETDRPVIDTTSFGRDS